VPRAKKRSDLPILLAFSLITYQNENTVRKLIRHKPTKAFFRKGKWVEDLRQAQEFPDVGAVLQAQAQYHLKDVELYYVSGDAIDAAFDVVVPLR